VIYVVPRRVALCVKCSLQQIREKLSSLSQDESLENDECLVMFVLSHGKVDAVFGSDGRPVAINEFLLPFTNARCTLLKNKPKLMFFQACRGGTLPYLSYLLYNEFQQLLETFLFGKLVRSQCSVNYLIMPTIFNYAV